MWFSFDQSSKLCYDNKKISQKKSLLNPLQSIDWELEFGRSQHKRKNSLHLEPTPLRDPSFCYSESEISIHQVPL